MNLVWIKAHVGHTGNELADKLAKEGTIAESITEIRTPGIIIKNKLKDEFIARWNEDWQQYKHARQTKQFITEHNAVRSKEFYKLSRIKLGTIVRVITGHNNLGYHMSKMVPGFGGGCRFCEETTETFVHFLTDCPKFSEVRGDTFLTRTLEMSQLTEIKTADLIAFAEHPEIADALLMYGDFDGGGSQEGRIDEEGNARVNLTDCSED